MESHAPQARILNFGLALAIAVLALTVLFVQGADARTIKVHASKLSERSVTFEPRGVDAATVEGASVRILGRSRVISTSSARRGVENGRLKLVLAKGQGFLRGRQLRHHAASSERRLRQRALRHYTLIVRANDGAPTTGSGSSTPPTGSGPTTPATGSSPAPTGLTITPDMLMAPERLASLPTSGPAYEYMKDRADAAVANMNLSSVPDATSPWLPNYNGAGEVSRPGTQTLAAALVYARTGDTRYRDFVIAANRYLIGTETEQSTDGTAEQDKLLATSRQIGAFVVAADLVEMDPKLNGSRPGWSGTSWGKWISGLRTEKIGTSGQAANMTQLSDQRANNWGSFARAARIAIDIYISDKSDLSKVVERFKLFVGEPIGGQTPWLADQDLDMSFSCPTSASRWTAINPSGCGAAKDGMIVEDLSRSATAFPSYDSTGIGYTMESYQAMLFSAVLLERQGYDSFGWGDQALRRVMDWLTREGIPQGNGSTVERHESWVAQYFYGKSYPTVPASMGRSMGFTDWLYGS